MPSEPVGSHTEVFAGPSRAALIDGSLLGLHIADIYIGVHIDIDVDIDMRRLQKVEAWM